MAGPWFTVQKSNDDWQELGHIWISDGAEDRQGRIEMRLSLEHTDEVQ